MNSLYYHIRILLFALLLPLAANADNEYSVTTDKGGSLMDKLPAIDSVLAKVEQLTVSGPINGTDIEYLHQKLPNLQTLNLTEARIVNGGDSYHRWTVDNNGNISKYGSNSFNTVNDVVGEYMFAYMPSLRSISLPSTATKILHHAFSDCRNLGEVIIPSSVDSIGNAAFSADRNYSYCNKIKSLTLPEGLKQINDNTFYGMKSLATINIPASVASIGKQAFRSCDSLKSVVLPDNLVSIGEYAFYDCKTVAGSIDIPSTIATIPTYAFYGCSKLMAVNFHEGLTSIGNYAFDGCKSLTDISLPTTLTTLGDNAFANCSKLVKAVLPKEKEELSSGVLQNCTLLSEVSMPTKLTKIGNSLFSNCSSLESVTMPDNISQLPDYTFQNCAKLSSVVLPSTIASIGSNAFEGCASLKEFDFSNFPQLKSINYGAFKESGITEAMLPDHITSIGTDIFHDCASLLRAKLPAGVTVVPSRTFINCRQLATVTLGDGIRSIEYEAFSGCGSLELTELPMSLQTIQHSVFSGCRKLAITALPAGLKTIGQSAFYNTGIQSIIMPDSITSFSSNVFSGCDSLVKVVLPANIKEIPFSTFLNCSNLTDITLPDDVTSIGTSAFSGCKSLATVRLPASLKKVDSQAFFNTISLTEIQLPASLKTIGSSAFAGSGLTSIEIPDSVTSLGSDAFRYCKSLKKAVVGRSVDYSTSFTYFYSCPLELLRLYTGTPPQLSSNYYINFRSNCILEVPMGTDGNYAAANYWKEFKEIRTFVTGDKLAAEDFAIMKAIYRQLDGENWTNKWDLTTDDRYKNKWYGVTTEGDHITEIVMESNNLTGELPDSIFRLAKLAKLSLINNNITGRLETILGDSVSCPSLSYLCLAGNKLEGDAGPFLRHLLNLTYINLRCNRLTGMSCMYTNGKLTSNSNFLLDYQFLDYNTAEPIVTDAYPAQKVTLGVPFQIDFNTLQRYDHAKQNYELGVSFLYNRRLTSGNNFRNDEYPLFQLNDEMMFEPYFDNSQTKEYKLEKGKPVAISGYYSSYCGLGSDYSRPSIVIFDWIDGDINGDQSVDASDLQKLIYYALYDSPSQGSLFNFTSADGNGDNQIDVRDAVINVNRILDFGGTSAQAKGLRMSPKAIAARNNCIISNGALAVESADAIAALQFTVDGAHVSNITLATAMKRAGYQMAKRQVGNNVRIVVYNTAGNSLPAGNHDILHGLTSGSAIIDVRLCDVEGNALEASCSGGEATGISNINDGNQKSRKIYDVVGRKVVTPTKGVYIMNGKKIIK